MIVMRYFAFVSIFLSLAWPNPVLAHESGSGLEHETHVPPRQMLSIEWNKGVSLPQGFQDSAGAIVNNTLISVCGFCQGTATWANREVLDRDKLGRYPRGFLNKVWGLNLNDSGDHWVSLPDFPGTARQMLMACATNRQLYAWGGFNYTSPYCYKDGYRLFHQQGQWHWDRLPDLPWRVYGSGICAHKSKIYLIGGADFDNVESYTESNRTGDLPRIGSKLLMIDVDKLGVGWKELAMCPGTPRCAPATAIVDGRLYVLGGGTGTDNADRAYRTIVDNWYYDISTNRWHRLPDLPVASACFPSGQIVAFNRYIIMVGGYQYKNVLAPDGSVQPSYGSPIKHYPHEYNSDVFVYDTKLNEFGTATPLPLNNFMPMTVVNGNHIHLIGGETGGSVVEGEPFGHHPELYLIGLIRELRE